MKNLATIILCLAFTASIAQPREIVPIVYSWAASDPAANFDRAIVEESNSIQNKYLFVFEARPGGGGVVPAMYTLNTPNAILATSSAFFIRPVSFPKESYDIAMFRGFLPKCEVTALVVSSRYQSWQEVPRDKPLSIGITGLGTTTHLIAQQIVHKYPNIAAVPFKGSSESLINVLNGTVDFSINFLGDIESWQRDRSSGRTVHVLGVTGSRKFQGYETLVSQGFGADLAEMSPPHQYIASAAMPDHKFQEIRAIMQEAQQKPRVQAAYAIDRCTPMTSMTAKQSQEWYDAQASKWRRLGSEVKN